MWRGKEGDSPRAQIHTPGPSWSSAMPHIFQDSSHMPSNPLLFYVPSKPHPLHHPPTHARASELMAPTESVHTPPSDSPTPSKTYPPTQKQNPHLWVDGCHRVDARLGSVGVAAQHVGHLDERLGGYVILLITQEQQQPVQDAVDVRHLHKCV